MGISNENKNIFTDFFDHLTPANLEETRKCLGFFLKKTLFVIRLLLKCIDCPKITYFDQFSKSANSLCGIL